MEYKNSESLWMQSIIDYILLTASFNIEKYTQNYLQVWKIIWYLQKRKKWTKTAQDRLGSVPFRWLCIFTIRIIKADVLSASPSS